MSDRENLATGTGHADKIGRIVTVDVENGAKVGVRGGLVGVNEGGVIVSGVLSHTEDHFDKDELVRTLLTVGGTFVLIDWSNGNGPATIEAL